MKSIFLKNEINAKTFLVLIPLLITCHWLGAQKDNFVVIDDIDNQLRHHTITISQVLTNKNYEILHPDYVKTDKNGQFELHTIKPNGYPQSDLPAHIHIEINGGKNGNKISELLFDDNERLKGSIRTNAEKEGYLIGRPEAAQAPFAQQFTYALKL